MCRCDCCNCFTGLLSSNAPFITEQLNVLREQVKLNFYEDTVSHWYTEEGFQTLFALLGANQQGIGTSSLSVWVNNCDKLKLFETEKENLDEFIDNLYEELGKGIKISF